MIYREGSVKGAYSSQAGPDPQTVEADSPALSANVIGHYHCFISGYHGRGHHGSASVFLHLASR